MVGSINHDCLSKLNTYSFANNVNLLAIAKEKTAYIWDLNNQKLINTINNDGYIYSATLSDDGRYLCTGTIGNNEANVWVASTGEKIAGPLNHENGVLNCKFYESNGILFLITASGDEKIRIW